MTLTNHVAAGALIALAIDKPVIALPLALVSHFALDALPHYGYNNQGYGTLFRHKSAYVVQAVTLISLLYVLYLLRHESVWIYVAGIVAAAPDLMWPYRYFGFERHGKNPPGGAITHWHEKIQWCERPWGISVEVVFFGLLLMLLRKI